MRHFGQGAGKISEVKLGGKTTSEKIRYNRRELRFCKIIQTMSPEDKVTTRTAEQARG